MLPLFFIVFVGGLPLLIACFLLGVLAIREFFNGFENIDIKPSKIIAYVSAVLLYSIDTLSKGFWLNMTVHTGYLPDSAVRVSEITRVNLIEPMLPETLYMLWFFGVIIAGLIYMFNMEKRGLADGAFTITGIVYIIFFSHHITLVDSLDGYSVLVWLIFLSAFGTDVMAYFSGYLFGKHKLCPSISPKKTVEGAIGGTIGSVIICGVFGYFAANEFFIHCLIIGALGSIISQFGDLTASVFKRKMGIKDYGNLIPGHGGVLDRVDSVLFTAPFVYYYIVIII